MRYLRLRPWTLAPIRLLRAPGLFLAIAVTAGVLGLAAGSRPLFVSSSASAALHDGLKQGCPYDVGLRVHRNIKVTDDPTFPMLPLPTATGVIDRAVSDIRGVAPAITTLYGPPFTVINGEERVGKGGGVLVARSGAFDHIDIVSQVDTPGIWLPDTTADEVDVTAGQQVTLRFGGPPQSTPPAFIPVTVQGVFRDLNTVRRDSFWCSQERLFKEVQNVTPPRVALADASVLVDVTRRVGGQYVEASWEYPPDPDGWTLGRARDTTKRLTDVANASNNEASDLGRQLGFGRASVDTQGSLAHAEDAARTASASIGPVALGSAGVALLMLTIAVRTWLDRRRKELTALALRGASSFWLAVKGLLEMATPMVVGAAAGLGAGYVLVQRAGPSDLIETSEVRTAALLVIAGIGVAAVTIFVVVLPGVRHVGVDTEARSSRSHSLLWEPVALAGAAAAYYELRTQGSIVRGSRVDALTLLFPILLLAGTSGLCARLLLRGRLLWSAAGRLPLAGRLAARRVVASRLRATAVITGAAISIGLLLFAGSLRSSLQATTTAKSTIGLGSTQVFRLDRAVDDADLGDLARVSTPVIRTTETSVVVRGHPSSDVLGIDPATFEHAAFWDGSFADRSLSSLVRSLDESTDQDAAPAIAVGDGLPDRFVLRLPTSGADAEIPVRVVGRAKAFPGFGLNSSRPLVVVTRAILTEHGVVETPQLWVDSDDSGVESELRAAGVPVLSASRADPATQQRLQPQVRALDYIRVIGLVAALVPLCGLGFYFGALGHQRRLGVAFARTLGVPRRTAVAATAAEIGSMLIAGLAFGIGGAWAAIKLVYRYLDPLPNSPPAPLFRFDGTSIALCAVGVVVATLLATAIVERRAARSSLPTLLRYAT